METYVPQNPVSSDSLMRRWACASVGGLLAVAGYASLTNVPAPRTIASALPTNTASLTPASAAIMNAAIDPVARDVAMGALLTEDTHKDLVTVGKPEALLRLTTPTTQPTVDVADAGFEAEHLTGVAATAEKTTPVSTPASTDVPVTLVPMSAIAPEPTPDTTAAPTAATPIAPIVAEATFVPTIVPADAPIATTPIAATDAVSTPAAAPALTPVATDAAPTITVLPTPAEASTAAAAPKVVPAPKTAAVDTLDTSAHVAAVTWKPTPTSGSASTSASTPTTQPTKGTIVSSGLNSSGKIAITVNRTAEVKTNVPVKRVSVGQPDIADVQPFSSNILLVTAKKPGTTQVIVWDDKDQSQSIDVSVEIPLDQLKDLIAKVAPGSNIEVAVANDQIVLRGQAPNLTVAKQITDLAGAFGRVQNFIEVAGAQTVAVQVQFAEVSRSVTNSLGVNWGFTDGTSIFGNQIGGIGNLGFFKNGDGVITGLGTGDASSTQADIFGTGRIGNSPFSYFIKALRENNLLRVLQEPTLTTTSGEAASFLAGGQIPVPVPGDNGQTQIEYKEFGVRLKLTPVVLGNGKVRLVMEAESSDLDYANGTKIQGASVPGLRTRRVQNTVELGEGQTMSVAGLLDDSVVATRQSFPGLGDLPVIGQLFRSTRYQRQETELVILITPRLSGAMNPDQVTPLPGAGWRHPNELEQFAFGDMGGNKEADATRDWRKPASQRGLKPGETQRNTNRAQEPAAISQANVGATPQASVAESTSPAPLGPPPAFIGEHGFTPAVTKTEGNDATATTGKD